MITLQEQLFSAGVVSIGAMTPPIRATLSELIEQKHAVIVEQIMEATGRVTYRAHHYLTCEKCKEAKDGKQMEKNSQRQTASGVAC